MRLFLAAAGMATLEVGAGPHRVAIRHGPLIALLVLRVATAAKLGSVRVRVRDRQLGALMPAPDPTQQRAMQQQAAEEERLHDARSIVLGLRGASRMLAEPSGLDGSSLQHLGDLVASELDRLCSVLDPSASTATDFDLAAAAQPVLDVHRLMGGTVEADFGGAWVHGCVSAVTTALGNLLANVRSHAAGSTVSIRAARRAHIVTVWLADDGPGIPTGERHAVMARGVRGSTTQSPGRGLGLHTAAHAIAEQGGSLEVYPHRPCGTLVTITLPAAAPRAHERAAGAAW